MLEPLLGNITVEKALLYLYSYGEGYAKGMADNFKIYVNAMQKQLVRLENGGIIVSVKKGKTRIYQFNPRYYLLDELEPYLRKRWTGFPTGRSTNFIRRGHAPEGRKSRE